MWPQQLEEETRSTWNEQALASLSYNERAYVAVLSDDKECPFWISQKHSSKLTTKKTVHSLMAHWLQAEESIYDSPYTLPFNNSYQKKPWLRTISVCIILANFSGLTSKNFCLLPCTKHFERSMQRSYEVESLIINSSSCHERNRLDVTFTQGHTVAIAQADR